MLYLDPDLDRFDFFPSPDLELFQGRIRLQLHGAIYRPDSFVLMQRYCANLKAIRYESTSFNRIVADKSHRVIAALVDCIKMAPCLPKKVAKNCQILSIFAPQKWPFIPFVTLSRLTF